jgi:hypothetical protein
VDAPARYLDRRELLERALVFRPARRLRVAAAFFPAATRFGDFRLVVLRPVLFRAVDLFAVDFRPVDFRLVVLRPVVLRPVVLRPVLLRPVVLRPVVFRAVDLFAVDFRAVDFRLVALRPVVLRPVVFRAVVLRPVLFRAVDFFAVDFLAADFLAPVFFAALRARVVDFLAAAWRFLGRFGSAVTTGRTGSTPISSPAIPGISEPWPGPVGNDSIGSVDGSPGLSTGSSIGRSSPEDPSRSSHGHPRSCEGIPHPFLLDVPRSPTLFGRR